jgi:hypothetical protein
MTDEVITAIVELWCAQVNAAADLEELNRRLQEGDGRS